MILSLLRRGIGRQSVVNLYFPERVRGLCFRTSRIVNNDDTRATASTNYSSGCRSHVSSLLSDSSSQPGGFDIELVDDDTWQASTSIVHAWREFGREVETRSLVQGFDQRLDDDSPALDDGDPDFDDIDNLRIRGDLFYKIDRGSKEFEEFGYDFHRRKPSKKDNPKGSEKKESLKKNDDPKEIKKKEKVNVKSTSEQDQLHTVGRNENFTEILDKVENSCVEKRVRTPTFNQLTGPYHQPFCLDIFISKASVRASIIHRVTSRVVAVAHSISKDIKFDLASTRNATACAAVGQILAQRALADDIHDVVYTPRKGDKLEGKLQIVLQSIIDNGVKVKVKLKQRRTGKAVQARTT